jgi:hypothetical protein
MILFSKKHYEDRINARNGIFYSSLANHFSETNNFRAQFKSEPEFQQMLLRIGSNEGFIRDEIRVSLKLRTFLSGIAADVPVPSAHLMKEYYERNPAVSVKPVEVRASHIVKKP